MKKGIINLKAITTFLVVAFSYLRYYDFGSNLFYYKYIDSFFIIFLSLILALLGIQILKAKIPKKKLMTFVFLLLLVLFASLLQRNAHLLIQLLLGLLFLYEDDREFIKYFFYSHIIMFPTTIFFNVFGLTNASTFIRDTNYKIRYSLGFAHPNIIFLYFMPIVFSGIYLYGNSKAFKIFMLVLSFLLYIFSDSRTGLIITVSFILFSSMNKSKIEQITKKIAPYLLPLTFLVTVVVISCYQNGELKFLNQLLSGRLYYVGSYMENNSLLSLTGNYSAGESLIDNFSVFIIIEFGIIVYLTYVYVFYRGLKLIQNKKIVIIAIFFILYGLSGKHLFVSGINFTTVFMFKAMLSDKKKLNRSEIIV